MGLQGTQENSLSAIFIRRLYPNTELLSVLPQRNKISHLRPAKTRPRTRVKTIIMRSHLLFVGLTVDHKLSEKDYLRRFVATPSIEDRKAPTKLRFNITSAISEVNLPDGVFSRPPGRVAVVALNYLKAITVCRRVPGAGAPTPPER
ncbi:hypothetical protein EVAR_12737_1 [Eumeta japonica]|uniref:Uncharacterized protein n=1 Tax=Eumeta variegata TaxID=151549 RepID=A0A4C1UMM8_EUMVA|nr:hypothetical protein EVAR_12737_1 [Eumeta japonica]